MVSFPRQVPAGSEEKISVSLSTKNYGGKTAKKIIRIVTNDPKNPELSYLLNGKVNAFATISPKTLRIYGKVGDTLEDNVTIRPSEAHPFVIKRIEAGKKSNREIRTHFDEVTTDQGKEYRVNIKAIFDQKGSFSEKITIITDSDIRPTLSFNIRATVVNQETSAIKP